MHPTAISSGLLNAGTTTLFTGKVTMNHLQILTDGTNAATVTVYDNTAGSGNILAKAVVAGTSNQYGLSFPTHVRGDIGLTIVISGTGAQAIVHYMG